MENIEINNEVMSQIYEQFYVWILHIYNEIYTQIDKLNIELLCINIQ